MEVIKMIPMQIVSELPGISLPVERSPDPLTTTILNATTAPPPTLDHAKQNTISRTLPIFVDSVWNSEFFRILVIILVFKKIYEMVI